VGADVLSGSGGDGVRDFCFGDDILATHAEEKSSEKEDRKSRNLRARSLSLCAERNGESLTATYQVQ
jgi:hypothetical protein